MKMIRYNPTTGEKVEFQDDRPFPEVRYNCPCCRYKTLVEQGGYEICAVCFWEDDGQNDTDADLIRGGPNADLSLNQARRNFETMGACEQSMIPSVRAPYKDEKRAEC